MILLVALQLQTNYKMLNEIQGASKKKLSERFFFTKDIWSKDFRLLDECVHFEISTVKK